MRAIACWILAALALVAGPGLPQDAQAQAQGAEAGSPVLVELFTSQGCSSCPAADALLAKLAGRDDVIALALHVDYWDYIGWKDKFASPVYTARQKGYAASSGSSRIYTPQMIVNGTYDVVGNRAMDVADIIQRAAGDATPVRLRASRSGDTVSIHVETTRPVGASDIHLVSYTPSQTVDIQRGENAGRKLTYTHIVSDWAVIGHWPGQGAYDTTAKAPAGMPVVVLVQGERYGPVFAAARLR